MLHRFPIRSLASCLILLPLIALSSTAEAEEPLPYYLHDRGTGIPTSMFGTYINSGETIIYPFVEFYFDSDGEYSPSELGYGDEEDYRGEYTATEALLYLARGINDMVMVEFEMAYISAEQHKSDDDPSAMPDKITQSGLGDVEGQIRWRYNKETEVTPEYFSYFEVVFPTADEYDLIGTYDWEFKFGTGVTRGFHWGTMTGRVAVEYVSEEDKYELGEYAVEYLKRVNSGFRYYLGVEGSEDEVEAIVDLQFHLSPQSFIRVNSGFGITSKATDFAPEIGYLYRF